MYYSIIPTEDLLEFEYSDKERKEIEIRGVKLEVELTSHHSGKIVKIISSNPQDYLYYQPGQEIDFGTKIK
jgi:hypothetical protein